MKLNSFLFTSALDFKKCGSSQMYQSDVGVLDHRLTTTYLTSVL